MTHTKTDRTYEADQAAVPFVATFDRFGCDDLELAGGKGANLGELVRRGYLVPDGFVVTTDAYAAVVERAGLQAKIAERLAAGGNDGAIIRSDFGAVGVPDDVRSAIVDAYARLGRGPVAVRSSATAEDLPGAAFAGQQDTYLNLITDDAVVDAVGRCWASLWTERAIAYRLRRGIDSADVQIAVVVQEMVEAETAGVLFTANPVTGSREEIVVDASAGLGEAVVSGLVTPDHYVLDETGKIIDWKPGRHEVVIRSATGGGVTHERNETTNAPRLSDSVLAELARLGTSVAAHFGRPQDLEWAVANGKVHLLQARPMTALPPPPLKLTSRQRRSMSIPLDYLTVRPYPLDLSTWMEHGPLGMVVRMLGSIGLRMDMMAMFQEESGVVYSLQPPSIRPTPLVLVAPFLLVRRARKHDPARWTSDARFIEYQERLRDLSARDLNTLPWADLLRQPHELLSLVDYVTSLRIDYLPNTGLALARLKLALGLLGFDGEMSDLLIAPTKTTATNDALTRLAELARADDDLRAAFAELPAGQVLERVRNEPRYAAFDAALTDFLAEYGHRETASPVLVSPPTWIDAPETVLDLIAMMVASSPPPEAIGRGELAMRRLLARPGVGRFGLQEAVTRWVNAARRGAAFREDTHFEFTRPLPVLRRTLLEIGRRLQDVGVLADPFDVFHLRLTELTELPEPSQLPAADVQRLRSIVIARSVKRDELAGVRMIDVGAVFAREDTASDALVTGTPACGGRVTGTVRVIRTPAEFSNLKEGNVLVCPYTNPAWTPLFQRAAAVVVDTGGPGSHAAIVAREYGLPAIMGTGVATTVLADGQRVIVDGDLGQVLPADGVETS